MWAITNKHESGRFLGALGTWWYWLEPSHESIKKFETRQQAEDFADLLPMRVKKHAAVCEAPSTP